MTDKKSPTSLAKTWYVYMLLCVDDSLYTGIAVDIDARYRDHILGKGARYTRSHPPVAIVYRATFADRSSASKEESRIKKLTSTQKRQLLMEWEKSQC